MPRKDGTGPMNGGPKTGRGLGNCTNGETTLSENGLGGSGRGLGGFGSGKRNFAAENQSGGNGSRGRGCRKGNGNGFGRCSNKSVENKEDANLR